MQLKDFQEKRLEKISYNARFAQKNGVVLVGDEMIEAIKIDYINANNKYNCGIKDLTSDTLLHVSRESVGDYLPKKVVILVGSNDLNDEYQFDKLDIAFNLYKFIEIITSKYLVNKVIVISPLPINEKTQKTSCRNNIQLKLLGEEIEKITLEFKEGVYLNVFDKFLAKKNLKSAYSEDGRQLNEKGIELLTSLINGVL